MINCAVCYYSFIKTAGLLECPLHKCTKGVFECDDFLQVCIKDVSFKHDFPIKKELVNEQNKCVCIEDCKHCDFNKCEKKDKCMECKYYKECLEHNKCPTEIKDTHFCKLSKEK